LRLALPKDDPPSCRVSISVIRRGLSGDGDRVHNHDVSRFPCDYRGDRKDFISSMDGGLGLSEICTVSCYDFFPAGPFENLIVDCCTLPFSHPEDFVDGIRPNPAGYA
jgi:hypothetical protein